MATPLTPAPGSVQVVSLLVLQLAHELALPLLPGRRLTLTLVADEETGGQLGTQWLLDNVPGCIGTCSLNSEPTIFKVLIGHKGMSGSLL